MNRKRAYLLLVVFLIIILPLLIILLLKTGRTQYVSLPVYGTKTIDSATGDSIPYKVPAFSHRDQAGQAFTSAGLEGQVYVVHISPAHCDDTCKKVVEQLMRVQNSFTNIPAVTIMSLFSIDSAAGGAGDFALQHEIDPQHWKLVSMTNAERNELWTEGFLQKEGEYDKLVLVDQRGRIRGIYDATQREEGSRLMDEINLLIKTNGR